METLHKGPAAAAKALKAELRAKFPAIVFSVKSKSYSGGSSINVRWNFGPTCKAVEAVASKYQYGEFDGMTDCYHYEDTLVSCEDGEIRELGGAKFVFCTRDTESDDGDAFLENVGRDYCKLFGVPFTHMNAQAHGETLYTQVYRALQDTDLTNGYHGLRCESGRVVAF